MIFCLASGGYQVTLGDRQTQASRRTPDDCSSFVGRRDVGHVGKDAQGEARIWPKGGRQVGPQQPQGTPDGEVHYEVFGWWHVLQQVECALSALEQFADDDVGRLWQNVGVGYDVGPVGGGLSALGDLK